MLNLKSNHRNRRCGVAHLLIAFMIGILVTVAGVTVNLGYVQLLRTQQKVALDSATKAAVEALSRTENQEDAISAAETIAELHQVGNRQFSLNAANIEFGNSVEQENGTFGFELNQTPTNAARITSNIGTAGETGAVSLFFSGLGHGQFKRSETSVSAFIMNEVVLCLDRSGSMKFDMTGATYAYPPNNPYVNSNDFWDNYYGRPHPTNSRWAVLMSAIDTFLLEAENSIRPPRVGLVTWSSSSNSDGTSTVDYALPADGVAWSVNKNAIVAELGERATGTNYSGVYGGTEMAMGMQAGVAALQTANAHDMANRVMVLLTDGEYQGDDPITVAYTARDDGITIHCISLLAGTTFAKAQEIAEATGGGAYMATNATELEEAFAEIARSMKVVLTQ